MSEQFTRLTGLFPMKKNPRGFTASVRQSDVATLAEACADAIHDSRTLQFTAWVNQNKQTGKKFLTITYNPVDVDEYNERPRQGQRPPRNQGEYKPQRRQENTLDEPLFDEQDNQFGDATPLSL
jgi:hypothetical protein